MSMLTRRQVLAGSAALATGLGSRAQAQDYPNRLIKILIGFPPGGNADAVARILAEQLERTLGQTVVVEAKPGASGSLAAEAVARSAPDGYTLLAVPNVHPMHGALSAHLRYKVVDDFTWISTATFFPYVICVRADSKIETLRQLIETAQARPGTLNYGGGQIGTGMHMVVELIANRSAAKFTRIPYRGENDAILALLGGEVDFIAATAGPVTAHIASGQLRALAVTSKKRWQGTAPVMAEVPTVAEAGMPGFDITGWMGLAGPANLPSPVVDRLHAALRGAVAMPEVRSRLEALGGVAQALMPDDMRALVARQYETWKQLGQSANIVLD